MVKLGPENVSFTGRDVYSIGHFPIIFGVIAYASAIAEVIKHSTEPVHFETKIALVTGIVLFVSGIAVVMVRATGEVLKARLIIPLVLAFLILIIPDISPMVGLLLIFTGIVIIGIIEEQGH